MKIEGSGPESRVSPLSERELIPNSEPFALLAGLTPHDFNSSWVKASIDSFRVIDLALVRTAANAHESQVYHTDKVLRLLRFHLIASSQAGHNIRSPGLQQQIDVCPPFQVGAAPSRKSKSKVKKRDQFLRLILY